MKKIYRMLSLLLCLCMLISFCGCSNISEFMSHKITFGGSSASVSGSSSESTTTADGSTGDTTLSDHRNVAKDKEPMDFSSISYTPFDGDAFMAKLDEATALLSESGNEQKLMDTYYELAAMSDDCLTAYSLSELYSYQDYNNEALSDACAEAYTVATDCNDAFCTFLSDMLKSDYRQTYIDEVGEDNALQYEDYEALTEEQKTLLDREKALEDEYTVLAGNDYGDDYGALAAAMAPLYLEMVDVRNQIATSYGYDNYAAYAYENTYYRSYTLEDAQKLEESVKSVLAPLYIRLIYTWTEETYDLPYKYDDTSSENIFSIMQEYVPQIAPQLGDTLDYLIECNLYDIDYSDAKYSAGFTTMLNSYGVPFLYNQPEVGSQYYALGTAVHEFGHFNTFLNDTTYSTPDGFIYSLDDIDVAEIDSTSMELLFLQYYDEIYGEDGDAMKISVLTDTLSNVIQGCIMDEFQQRIYTEENLTEDRISEICNEVINSYMPDIYIDDYNNYLWAMINHNFASPMYYISYAVSALAAFQVWELSQEDYSAAVDLYLDIVDYGTNIDFVGLLEKCDMKDIFEKSTITQLSTTLRKVML